MSELKRTDVALLEDADRWGSIGINSHHYSAAARKRLIKLGFIVECGQGYSHMGQYRSRLFITNEGRGALTAARSQ